MSNETSKLAHSKRIQKKEVYAKKQNKIAKQYGIEVKSETHMEHSAVTCGNSNCIMCANPRKVFKEQTIQEKSFKQTENWYETE